MCVRTVLECATQEGLMLGARAVLYQLCYVVRQPPFFLFSLLLPSEANCLFGFRDTLPALRPILVLLGVLSADMQALRRNYPQLARLTAHSSLLWYIHMCSFRISV